MQAVLTAAMYVSSHMYATCRACRAIAESSGTHNSHTHALCVLEGKGKRAPLYCEIDKLISCFGDVVACLASRCDDGLG
jgi:hypothetical protein